MRRILFSMVLLMLVGGSFAHAQDFDDIYYNPKKDNASQTKKAKKQSYYIKDFENIDVDEYNRRGQYYNSPIDTIGSAVENGEDFVYTQQIQKYYNPTIVVDNANVLGDILENSYGNVEIVFDNGNPYFASSWAWPYYSPYYTYGWNDPWYWGWGSRWNRPYWSWGPSWTWGPSWAWGWNDPWNWGWGPSWSWGPSWGWHHPGAGWHPSRPVYSNYRPNGRKPNNPGGHWASNTRPGGNVSSGSNRYPSASHAPSSSLSSGKNNIFGGSATNHHRSTAGNSINTQRNGVTNSNSNNGYTNSNSNNHRGSNNTSTTNNSSRNSYNNSTNRNSYNSGSSWNTGRSSGGSSFGGSRSGGSYSGGGGARGRHR